MVVRARLGDRRHDRDVVPLGADVVRGGDHRDVDVVFAADLRLGDNELDGIGVASGGDGVVEDADRLEEVADDLDFAWEVAGVADDHAGFGREGHGLVVAVLHCGGDALDLSCGRVGDLVDVRVKHVCAAVDGGEAGKTLGELAEAVQRVNVGRFAVAGHRVSVEADARDSVFGHAAGGDVLVGGVEGHAVADEVAGGGFEAEFVVHIFHCAGVHVEAWCGSVGRFEHDCILTYRYVYLGYPLQMCPPIPGNSLPASSRTDPSARSSTLPSGWKALWPLSPAGHFLAVRSSQLFA